MGFVRVSGYSESDLELAGINGICNCEFYYLSSRPNDTHNTDTITYVFGKDYAWAIIVAIDVATDGSGWERTTGSESEVRNLAYKTGYSGTKANPAYDRPYIMVATNIKKGDYYKGNSSGNSVAKLSIIACPLNANEIGIAPDPDCGYFMYASSNPKHHRSATNYPYGTNFTNNINGEYGVHWYYPDTDTTPPVENIERLTSIPASSLSGSSGDSGNSGGSGESNSGGGSNSGGNNEPEDEDLPVNPDDPVGA